MINYRPTTPTQKIIRCISLMNKTTCEKRKKLIFMIKEIIIAKENERLEKYYSHPKVQAMYKKRDEINKKLLT